MNEINAANLGWAGKRANSTIHYSGSYPRRPVFASVFHILALVSTMLRLIHRLRTSRMWWDDYTVVLPLAMNTVNFASLWVLYEYQSQ